jgi:hypothetical protein
MAVGRGLSAVLEALYLSNYGRRRVPLRQGDADDAATASFDRFAPDDAVSRPVGTLHEDVGLQAKDDLLGIVLVEYDHGVNAAQRGKDFGAFAFRGKRSRRSFDGFHRPIGVQAHDQRVPFTARRLQIPNVPGMQEVEDTVGEHDGLSVVPQVLDQCHCLGPGEHFLHNRLIATAALKS